MLYTATTSTSFSFPFGWLRMLRVPMHAFLDGERPPSRVVPHSPLPSPSELLFPTAESEGDRRMEGTMGEEVGQRGRREERGGRRRTGEELPAAGRSSLSFLFLVVEAETEKGGVGVRFVSGHTGEALRWTSEVIHSVGATAVPLAARSCCTFHMARAIPHRGGGSRASWSPPSCGEAAPEGTSSVTPRARLQERTGHTGDHSSSVQSATSSSFLRRRGRDEDGRCE